MEQEKINIISSISDKVTYTGAGSAVFFGWIVNNFFAIIGVSIALASLLISWYYKRKAYMLLEARVNAQHRKDDVPEELEQLIEQSD